MVRDRFKPNGVRDGVVRDRQFWVGACLGAVLLSVPALSQTAIAMPQSLNPSAVELSQTQGINSPRLPQRVVQRVRRDAVQRFQLSPRSIQVVDFSRETWPDSCLGLAAANERCAMALVDGWRVEITNGQQNWIYRTDLTAQILRPEVQSDAAGLPANVSDRLLQTIAEQHGVPVNTLRIAEVQEATWNGCMGIFEPGRACTMIALPGWRVIIAGADQTWVYHISQDGSRIVENTTASGSRNGLIPSFIPIEQTPDTPFDPQVVFRYRETGGFAGMVSETVLMSDGAIYDQGSRPNSAEANPVLKKRLTPEQVEQFQQVLLDQRFPNLDRLRYLSPASLADYPTTTVQAMGSTVEFTDLEMEQFPSALQTVLQAWKNLQ